MKKGLKILTAVMLMALLLAIAAAPLSAASGPDGKDNSDDKSASEGSGSDDNAEKGDSGTSGGSASTSRASKRSDANDDNSSKKLGSGINSELKVEIKEGQDRLKVEAKEDGEVKVKAEARGGFAGFISRLITSLFGRGEKPSTNDAGISVSEAATETKQASEEERTQEKEVTTPAPGILINKSLSSGPGYPTGPLDLSVPATQLILDRVGQVKGGEVKDRQYEVEFAAVPVTINSVPYTATEVKVISNLKTKAGAGQHSGTIDVDIDVPLGSTLPSGHITLAYSGSAMISGSMITSGGVFKTSKMTGVFAGLVSEGTYSMSIIETGSTFGSPAIVSIMTTSNI